MKILFFLILGAFVTFSCEKENKIHSVLKFNKEKNKLILEFTNESTLNYYFYSNNAVFFNIIDSNQTNLYPKAVFDTIYQDTTIRTLKKIAFNNFYKTGEIFNNYDTSIIIEQPEKYVATARELDDTFFFIKPKSKLSISFNIVRIPTKTKYRVSYEPNIAIDKLNKNAVKKFYSYGKIGDYEPYTKNIESKPIIVGF